MDPQATWNRLLEAWADQDWPSVFESAQDLSEWLGKSGFPPKTMEGSGLGDDWHRALATAMCQFALNRARTELDECS